MIPDVAFIGAGRVAKTLARAFAGNGLPVTAIASRNAASARQLASLVPGSRAVPIDDAARAPLVFVTVPDDAIATVCSALAWRPGQQVVHCSGATDVAALDAAKAPGPRPAASTRCRSFPTRTARSICWPGRRWRSKGRHRSRRRCTKSRCGCG